MRYCMHYWLCVGTWCVGVVVSSLSCVVSVTFSIPLPFHSTSLLHISSFFQPASKQAILALLEKHKATLPPPKSAKAKATSSAKEKTETKETSEPPPAEAGASKETKTAKTAKPGSKTASKKGTSKKGKEVEEDSGPPLMKGPTMQQRQKDEQNFKVSSAPVMAG